MAKVRKRIGKKGVSWMIDYTDPLGKRVRVSFKKRKKPRPSLPSESLSLLKSGI